MLVFWGAFLCGQIIPFIFDFFRAMRKSFACGKKQVAFQDMIFCFLSFKIFFDMCYTTNNGHLRWYIFISFALSCIIYFLSLSSYAIKFWEFIFKIIMFFINPIKKFFSLIQNGIKTFLKKLGTRVVSIKSVFLLKFRQFVTKKEWNPHNSWVYLVNIYQKNSLLLEKNSL